MFNGIKWKTYTVKNSGLHSDYVNTIAIDGSGRKWFGTAYEFEFVFIQYQLVDPLDIPLISGLTLPFGVYRGDLDGQVDSYGVSSFDDIDWESFTTENSGLAADTVNAIAIDGSGDKWFGTWPGGVSRYSPPPETLVGGNSGGGCFIEALF